MSHLFPVESGELEEEFEELPDDPVSESQARSSLHGREFDQEAFAFLEEMGATILDRYVRVANYPLDALIEGQNGLRFYVDAHGTPDRADRPQAGMRRQDTLLKFGFKAMRLHEHGCPHPVILLTSHMPRSGTSSEFLLSELNDVLFDALSVVGDLDGRRRLHAYLTEPPPVSHLPAPWRASQLDLGFELEWDDA